MLEAFGASDPGCVRSNNEDYFLVVPTIGLYLVADGMGGAQAGEHASRMAAETIEEAVQQNGKAMDSDGLVVAFGRANQRVMDAAAGNPEMEGMGTTLVAAVENNGELVIASVGDSRVYTFENGTLQTITEDQTWVNEVGRRLGIDEENLKNHPMRHVLTMAIGVSENLRVHTHRIKPSPGMLILLCSDGLHGVVSEEEMKKALVFHVVARGQKQGPDRPGPQAWRSRQHHRGTPARSLIAAPNLKARNGVWRTKNPANLLVCPPYRKPKSKSLIAPIRNVGRQSSIGTKMRPTPLFIP